MPRSEMKSDFEMWSASGRLDRLKDFDSNTLAEVGQKLIRLYERAFSEDGPKANWQTDHRVQASKKPDADHLRALTAIDAKNYYRLCLSALGPDAQFVVHMVIEGKSWKTFSFEYKSLPDREGSLFARMKLCSALKSLLPAIRKLQKIRSTSEF